MMPDRYWRSVLYVPGDNPSMIQKSFVYGADAVTLDLEDAVGMTKKHQARYLVKNAIEYLDFENTDVFVRVNSIASEMWKKDLELLNLSKITAIRLPKAEAGHEIFEISDYLAEREKELNMKNGSVFLIPGIETAKGYLNLEKILNSSERVIGVGLGSEDFITDTGISRKKLETVKVGMVLTARAYGKFVLDSVYPDFSDERGFENECVMAHECGMDGKSLIHPSQIETANRVFSPSLKELETAREILGLNRKNSTGDAFNYKGQMVDKPIIERCERIVKYGEKNG